MGIFIDRTALDTFHTSKGAKIKILYLEYLSHSKDYRELCEFARNIKLSPLDEKREWKNITKIFPIKFLEKPTDKVYCLKHDIGNVRFTFFDELVYSKQPGPFRVYFDVHASTFKPIVRTYQMFGDIFQNGSKYLWVAPGDPEYPHLSRVEIKKDLEESYAIWKGIYGKKHVLISDFIKRSCDAFDNDSWFYIRVDPYGVKNIGILYSQFKNILRTWENEMEEKVKSPDPARKKKSPEDRIRFNKLERYLKIFKFRNEENLPYKEIAKLIFPSSEFDHELQNRMRKEKKMAETIIKNAEQGIFPRKNSIIPTHGHFYKSLP